LTPEQQLERDRQAILLDTRLGAARNLWAAELLGLQRHDQISELTVAWRLEDEGVNPLRLNTGQTRRSQVAFVSDGQNRAPRPGMACNAEIPSPAASFDQVTTND
jgi:hypothetical protein